MILSETLVKKGTILELFLKVLNFYGHKLFQRYKSLNTDQLRTTPGLKVKVVIDKNKFTSVKFFLGIAKAHKTNETSKYVC